MIELVKRLLIGGRTGKRELAVLILILWVSGFIWTTWAEIAGRQVAGAQSILSATALPVLMWVALAYGMQWVSTQTNWGGQPPEY